MLRCWRIYICLSCSFTFLQNGCEPTDANYATMSFSVPYGVISQYNNILQYTPVLYHAYAVYGAVSGTVEWTFVP